MTSKAVIIKRIQKQFQDSIATKQDAVKTLPELIELASQKIAESLKNQGKVLIAGNGGSAGDAQHFSGEFLNRFMIERPSLPAIALSVDSSTLTAIGNDYSFDIVFSKQLQALGLPQDIFIGISTSGNSKNIIEAIKVAHQKNMTVIVLTGNQGGQIQDILNPERDINLCVPSSSTPRIQETHIVILHCLCDAVDCILYPESVK